MIMIVTETMELQKEQYVLVKIVLIILTLLTSHNTNMLQ